MFATVCMHECMRVYTCARVCVYVGSHTCAHVCQQCMCAHMCMRMPMYVLMCISCTHVCVCTHTCVQRVRCRTVETRLKGGFCPQGSEKPRRALCWTQVTSACARRFPQAAGRTWGGASWSGQGEPLVAVSSGRRGGLDSGGVAMGAVQSPPARSPPPGPALQAPRPALCPGSSHSPRIGFCSVPSLESPEGRSHIWTLQPSGTQAGL